MLNVECYLVLAYKPMPAYKPTEMSHGLIRGILRYITCRKSLCVLIFVQALAANIRTFGALCIPFLGHVSQFVNFAA